MRPWRIQNSPGEFSCAESTPAETPDAHHDNYAAPARSVSDFDVHHALETCSDYFLKFGGHPAAAGLSMEKAKFEAFKEKFEKVVAEQIKEHQIEPSLEIDSDVHIDELNKDFFNFHRKLAPFGPQNMKPILVLKNQKVAGYVKTMGKENSHLKFYIKQVFAWASCCPSKFQTSISKKTPY